MPEPLLEVGDLTVDYLAEPATSARSIESRFTVHPGEFLGIVGESGCGKSTMLFAIAQLLSPPARDRRRQRDLPRQDMVRLTPTSCATCAGVTTPW